MNSASTSTSSDPSLGQRSPLCRNEEEVMRASRLYSRASGTKLKLGFGKLPRRLFFNHIKIRRHLSNGTMGDLYAPSYKPLMSLISKALESGFAVEYNERVVKGVIFADGWIEVDDGSK